MPGSRSGDLCAQTTISGVILSVTAGRAVDDADCVNWRNVRCDYQAAV